MAKPDGRMHPNRRRATALACACAVAATAGLSTRAAAQAFPSRAIRIVTPVTAGSSGDAMARTVGGKLSEMWGQQVVIDNRAGANTIIGAEAVARSKPDGYTWFFALTASLAINPVIYRKLPYDPVKDFEPVTQVATYGYLLDVHPSLPVRNVKELVALARREPGKLTYATSGIGGSNHLAGELFAQMTHVKWNHVPFKGSAPALLAVLGGDLPVMFDPVASSIPHLQSGRIRALAVSLGKRWHLLPDLPTIAEAGVPGYELDAWQAIVVPAGTDREIVRRIQADVAKVLAMPDVRTRLVDQGGHNVVGSTPEQLAAIIRSDTEKYRKLVAAAGIRAE